VWSHCLLVFHRLELVGSAADNTYVRRFFLVPYVQRIRRNQTVVVAF
jgi:hypothetical protein